MNRTLVSILALIFVSGCASGTQMLRKIDPGMSLEQVDNVMGRRDGFSSAQQDGDNYLLYKYINRFCNAHASFDKCDFYVIFKSNKVIETGVKDVRSAASPNMQFLYIFKQP